MGSLTLLDLFKAAANGVFWDATRYNSDQAAIQNAINKLISSTVDGDSGADNIKVTPLSDTGDADTVQEVLEALVTILKGVTVNSSGADFIGASSISGLSGNTVMALLKSLKTYLDTGMTTHKGSVDHDGQYYNQTQLGKYDGTGGATLIGNTPLAGIPGTNLHDQLVQLRNLIDQYVAGEIPDGSLQRIKLDPDTKALVDSIPTTFKVKGTLHQQDFNTVIEDGFYYMNEGTNYPENMNGYLFVKKFDDNHVKQEYTIVTTGVKYMRVKNNGVWGNWEQIITSNGGTFSASPILNNTVALKGKTPGGTPINMAWVGNDGKVWLGSPDGNGVCLETLDSQGIERYSGATGQVRMWDGGNSPASIAESGYQKLANGLIIQWGYAGFEANEASKQIYYPIAFPSRCCSCIMTMGGTASVNPTDLMYSTSPFDSAAYFRAYYNRPRAEYSSFNWIAIGY